MPKRAPQSKARRNFIGTILSVVSQIVNGPGPESRTSI
jgi:hypothetical protein